MSKASENICPKYVKTCKKFGWNCEKPTNSNSTNQQGGNLKLDLSKIDKQNITNLVSDLATVINENKKLTNENAMLKSNLQESNDKMNIIQLKFETESRNLSDELLKTQENFNQTQNLLMDKEKQFSKENQNNIDKLNDVKETYYKERDLAITRENVLKSEVENLKNKLDKSGVYIEDLLNQLKTSRDKVSAYKEKLKFSVNLLHEVNSFLNKPLEMQSKQSKDLTDKQCQTEDKLYKKKICDCRGCSLECENMILSELFFKENTFHANNALEEVFFKQNCHIGK